MDNLIPPELTPAQVACTYANEADMLNEVLLEKQQSSDMKFDKKRK